MQEMNPLLSNGACKNIFQLCLIWQEHCVLLELVNRCLYNLHVAASSKAVTEAANNSLTSVAVDLLSQQQWRSFNHPEWLALEVLQRIKIRPQQYTVAKQLLDNLGGAGLSEEDRGAVLQVQLPSTVFYKQRAVSELYKLTGLFNICVYRLCCHLLILTWNYELELGSVELARRCKMHIDSDTFPSTSCVLQHRNFHNSSLENCATIQ
jgi:hypothetical protein